MLGGVSRNGFLSDTILALLAIPLLAWGIWRLFDTEISGQMRGALWFCLALFAIPLLQLVPLPGWLWTLLPHREISAESFALLRQSAPWMPISVSPEATWLSALSLLPPLSLFVGMLLLGYRDRRWLSLVVPRCRGDQCVPRDFAGCPRAHKPSSLLSVHQSERSRRLLCKPKSFCSPRQCSGSSDGGLGGQNWSRCWIGF